MSASETSTRAPPSPVPRLKVKSKPEELSSEDTAEPGTSSAGGSGGNNPPDPPQSAASAEPEEPPKLLRRPTHLHGYSLLGDAAKLKAKAIETTPLFGDFVLRGQATMIYADANAGKTISMMRLCIEAIEDGVLDPDDLLYVNADDDSKGLATKTELFEAVGAHMLAPGHKGFDARDFADKLRASAFDGSARGRVFVIDTLKKFTNLMDKGRASEFAQVCRLVTSAGGTVVALGHTAKNRNADGSPRYQGVTDIKEDFDAVYVAEPLPGSVPSERIIRFTNEKARGDSPDVSAYAYSIEKGLSYEDKLWSVRKVYPEELERRGFEIQELEDSQVISELRELIRAGGGEKGQDHLIRCMAREGDISRAQAERVLIKYTGSDPDKHHWNFRKAERRKRVYYLNPRPSKSEDS